MSILTYITQAEIQDAQAELDGKILTRAALLVTDGLSVIYACDVDIGQKSPLKNVPIARGNRDLIYADVGAAVRLRRTSSGQYEIVGFSQEMPGTYMRIPLNLETLAFGVIEDTTLSSIPIPYGDLTYGVTPYGAIAVYQGNTLIEVVA